jgi:deoxyhypusine synthase
MYVHCDVTAVFPWLTYSLLSDARVHRKPRRLYDSRTTAIQNLQREVAKRRKKLLDTVKYALPKPKKKKAKKGANRRPAR